MPSTDDKIAALGAGADGYLTKPFDRFELLANLDAIIRRTHGHSSATVSVGNLEVDLNRHLALIDGEQLPLTGKEFRIVEFLALRKGSVLSKTAFLSHLYGGMDEPEPKIIDVFICKLRRKLEIAGARGVSIDTVWGQGYILRETEAVSQTPAGSSRQYRRCRNRRADRQAGPEAPRRDGRSAAFGELTSQDTSHSFGGVSPPFFVRNRRPISLLCRPFHRHSCTPAFVLQGRFRICCRDRHALFFISATLCRIPTVPIGALVRYSLLSAAMSR